MVLYFLLMVSMLALTVSANASIVLYGTRVVFPAGQMEVTLKISNEGARPSLVQAWLDQGDGDQAPSRIDVPFVIAPSLTRVEPGAQQMLRIIYSGQALPEDKESLFWINVLDVPPKSQVDPDSSGSLELAFRTRIKLMYRPKGLPGKSQDAPEQLQWSADTTDGGQPLLRARNATAYVANLGHIALEVEGKSFEARVGHVLPGETATFAFSRVAEDQGEQLLRQVPAGATVVYTSLNDWGGTQGHRVELAH